jgi:hypothetical protein
MIFSRLIKFVAAGLLAPAAFLALASMPAGASPKVTVLAFGLFGAQSVFESEAKGAARRPDIFQPADCWRKEYRHPTRREQ